MDYQNRVGSKKGGGGLAGAEETRRHQRHLVRSILSSSLENDPYFTRNANGTIECKLCLTLHYSEPSYINHTQGKKHNLKLLERQSRDLRQDKVDADGISKVEKKRYLKIGTPGYKITKIRDVDDRIGLLVVVKFPKLTMGQEPRYRVMSYFEQQKDKNEANSEYQYLVIHGEPYENICIKIPKGDLNDLWTYWDVDLKEYYIQFVY